MRLKIVKTHDSVKTPVKGSDGAAGIDLYVHSAKINGDRIIYSTGIVAEIPENHVGLLFPRSSIFKSALRLANSVGVIDSDYRGEIKVIMDIIPHKPKKVYKVGDRCAQLVIVPCAFINGIDIVDELTFTKRGQGGFGSTGE